MGDNWNSGSGDTWNAAPTDTWTGDVPNGDSFGADDVGNSFESADANGPHGHDGQDGGNAGGSACRNCGQDGHFARECTEPRKMTCFNCGEDGHAKAECTKPRVPREFTGTCNVCSAEGHRGADCPSKPKVCTRCNKTDDHDTKDCKNNYDLGLSDVLDISEGAAWSKVVDACLHNDMDDFKEALRMLQKAAPELTYPAIEKKLRAQHLRFYLIGINKEVSPGYTLVNLQGEPDQKFSVSIFKSPDPVRPNMVAKWPTSVEENLERLADAGVPLERGLPYCRNCSEFGHATRGCGQERAAVEPLEIKCALCEGVGHRVRDCPEPRKKPREPRTCKICGSEDHIAKECTEKPAMTCRNCDKEGHVSKDCDQPTDWSRKTCRHCGEKGHASANRCAPGAAEKFKENADNGGDHDAANENNHAVAAEPTTDEWSGNNGPSISGEWANTAATQTTGGW